MKKITIILVLIYLIPSTLYASEKYINDTYYTFLNYSDIKPQVKEALDNWSLSFSSNYWEIRCSRELGKCIIKTEWIYSRNIEIYTKLDDKIIKTDNYTIDKTELIASKLNLRTYNILRNDTEYLYSYKNEREDFRLYIESGWITVNADKWSIKCEDGTCIINTKWITYWTLNIEFIINGNSYKKIRLKIAKYSYFDLLKPLSKYWFWETLTSEENFEKINLRDIDYAKKNLNYARWEIFVNTIIKDDLRELWLNYKNNIGSKINITSWYRDFKYQQNLYSNYLRRWMQDYSTFAKRSEHHLWTALDFWLWWNDNNYAWLDNNSWKYWFIRSFTKECESKTAIKNEIWHFRWIWKEAAKDFHNKILSNPNYCAITFLRDNYIN